MESTLAPANFLVSNGLNQEIHQTTVYSSFDYAQLQAMVPPTQITILFLVKRNFKLNKKKLIELPKKQPCVFLQLYTPPKINGERHLIQKHIFHPPPFLRFPCQYFQGVYKLISKKSLLGSHGGSRSA